jgi:hypothetical protein
MDGFVRLLADLPAEISDIGNARKLAGEMADLIKAEIAKNPLLSFKGTPLDPAVLFNSQVPGKTRVSVINFVGLPADEAKQAFVNQLEMALFSWIKKNPSPASRPLTGLLSDRRSAELRSVPEKHPLQEKHSRARSAGSEIRPRHDLRHAGAQKYRQQDHQDTTHFYGKMNSPATIEAVRELMAAKGGSGSNSRRVLFHDRRSGGA